MKAQTKESQDKLTAHAAIELLKEGNARFVAIETCWNKYLIQLEDSIHLLLY